MRVPDGVLLHYGDIPDLERGWFGVVPITRASRTLNDCADASLSPELLQQAARQAIRRGLASQQDLPSVQRALKSFGGINI